MAKKTADAKGPGGAPDLFKIEYCKQAYKLCLLGATDASLADFFGVCVATINNWKIRHPEFLESLKAGKEDADATIAQSLYHRAKGYYHPEDKVFNDNGTPLVVPTLKHYPPDTTAAIFWLKNRQPKAWRDKIDVDNKFSGEITHNHRDLSKLSDDELKTALELARKLDGDKPTNG